MAATGPELELSGDDNLSAAPASAPEGQASIAIDCSPNAIELIRAETVAALLSVPHGGLEIAGVLFGKRIGSTLHISASRPIECEHLTGPSFALSEKDARQLETLLLASSFDPELAGLDVLGWYVSHTRRPFSLVPGDVDTFDRYFREPLKVTAIVQPAASGKARFGWFVRNQDGWVDTQRPNSELTIYPKLDQTNPDQAKLDQLGLDQTGKGTALYASKEIDKRADRSSLRRSRREQDRGALVVPFDPRSDKVQLIPPRWRALLSNRRLIVAGVLVLLAGGAGLEYLNMMSEAAPPPLHVLDTGTQLRIDWDPKSPLVQQALSGDLEVKEPSGEPVYISLSWDMLRSGSVFFDKPSSKVEVHLRLKDEKGVVSESMVYFIGREPEPKEPVEVIANEAAPLPFPDKARPLKVPPPFVDKGSAERARAQSVAAAPRSFRPPVVSKAASVAEPSLAEPPKVPILNSQAAMPLHTEVAVAAPPSEVVGTPAPKTTPQSTSGRLIWTGELHKGAVLHVTERGPSTGSLNGKLPARPIKVSVHSAELLDGVIAVYTPDADSTRTAEAPGRRNGWNVTMYKFDPKHVRDLSLVQTPAEDNNFELGIKSNNRPVSIIVIDWRAAN